jgi:hypothetical protein
MTRSRLALASVALAAGVLGMSGIPCEAERLLSRSELAGRERAIEPDMPPVPVDVAAPVRETEGALIEP